MRNSSDVVHHQKADRPEGKRPRIMCRWMVLLLLLVPGTLNAAVLELADGSRVAVDRLQSTREGWRCSLQAGGASASWRLSDAAVAAVVVADEAGPGRAVEPVRLGGVPRTYAVLTLRGRLGQAITAAGLDAGCRAAWRAGAGAVVLVVDSDHPEGAQEAIAIGGVLARWRQRLQVHVLVQRCRGPALVLPLLAHATRVAHGALLGGHDAVQPEDPIGADLRWRLQTSAQRLGRPGAVVAAMLDPAVHLAIWRADEGAVWGSQMPADLDPRDLIAQDADDAVLVLATGQLIALGMEPVTVQTPGAAAGLRGWRAVGAGPQTRMEQVVAAQTAGPPPTQVELLARIGALAARIDRGLAAVAPDLRPLGGWDAWAGLLQTPVDATAPSDAVDLAADLQRLQDLLQEARAAGLDSLHDAVGLASMVESLAARRQE